MKKTSNPKKLTPVVYDGCYWYKRDDWFEFNGARGGKVRACLKMAKGQKGLVTYASRNSPQQNYVSLVAEGLGIPCRTHTPHGAFMPEMDFAVAHGATIVQHKPGYLNNLKRYAEDAACQRGWKFVPLSVESLLAVDSTYKQVANLKHVGFKRIVVVTGGGISLAGILWGMKRLKLRRPVVGVCIGRDPSSIINKYAPEGWRDMVKLVYPDLPYNRPVKEPVVGGITVDSYFEAKCIQFLRRGDLFWIVGIRPMEG